jgi:hypothetical protein
VTYGALVHRPFVLVASAGDGLATKLMSTDAQSAEARRSRFKVRPFMFGFMEVPAAKTFTSNKPGRLSRWLGFLAGVDHPCVSNRHDAPGVIGSVAWQTACAHR